MGWVKGGAGRGGCVAKPHGASPPRALLRRSKVQTLRGEAPARSAAPRGRGPEVRGPPATKWPVGASPPSTALLPPRVVGGTWVQSLPRLSLGKRGDPRRERNGQSTAESFLSGRCATNPPERRLRLRAPCLSAARCRLCAAKPLRGAKLRAAADRRSATHRPLRGRWGLRPRRQHPSRPELLAELGCRICLAHRSANGECSSGFMQNRLP